MGHVGKVCALGSFYRAFAEANSESPLEGGAINAMDALTEYMPPLSRPTPRNENITTARKLPNQCEASMGKYFNDWDSPDQHGLKIFVYAKCRYNIEELGAYCR